MLEDPTSMLIGMVRTSLNVQSYLTGKNPEFLNQCWHIGMPFDFIAF